MGFLSSFWGVVLSDAMIPHLYTHLFSPLFDSAVGLDPIHHVELVVFLNDYLDN